MMEINELVKELYEAKQYEATAKSIRMSLEAALAQAIGVPEDWEGTKTNAVDKYKVTLTRKMNVKIDAGAGHHQQHHPGAGYVLPLEAGDRQEGMGQSGRWGQDKAGRGVGDHAGQGVVHGKTYGGGITPWQFSLRAFWKISGRLKL